MIRWVRRRAIDDIEGEWNRDAIPICDRIDASRVPCGCSHESLTCFPPRRALETMQPIE